MKEFLNQERRRFLVNLLKSPFIYFISFGLLIFFGLLPLFSNGKYLLGGDGDYHIKYAKGLRYIFAWNEDGLGLPNYATSAVWPFVFILGILERAGLDPSGVKYFLYFSQYFLCFIAAYIVFRTLKISSFVSCLSSLFYTLNPFSLVYFTSSNISLTIFPATIMFFFWSILKFYRHDFKLFFYFGLASFFLATANVNPPLLVMIQVGILISVVIASFYHEKTFSLVSIFKKYFLVLSSFILFNFWWLINSFSFLFSGFSQQIYTNSTANSFLNLVMQSSPRALSRFLTLTIYTPVDVSLNFFGYFYQLLIVKIIAFIPIGLVIYFLFWIKENRRKNLIWLVFFFSLIVLFFAKGSNSPFGFVCLFLFKYLPIFNIFKGPIEKFGLLYVFLFSLVFAMVISELEKRSRRKYFLGLVILYLSICIYPIFAGQMFTDSLLKNVEGYMTGRNYESRVYRDKKEYQLTREIINKDPSLFRVLGLPGSKDYYAVTFRIFGDQYYSGIDPLLANTSKPFLTFSQNSSPLYLGLSANNYEKLLGLYNIKKVVVNDELVPLYGFAQNESVEEIKDILGSFLPYQAFGSLFIYGD